jgi:class 3 adenylate cyclase
MANLGPKERARLPDSAFAYIDSRRRRLLPIHDEAHVRNALARFDRVNFENDGARKRARGRLLRAAKKHGIVPLGFLAGQLDPERKLPTGAVTFLLCDIEGSTALVSRLGDGYGGLLSDARRILRGSVRKAGGHEVDARADEFFAAFSDPAAALAAALIAQRAIGSHPWPEGVDLRVRMGIHSGRPTLGDSGYVGLAVHAAARVCGSAQGGQIVISGAAVSALGETRPHGIELRSLGEHRLRGLPQPMELFDVVV